MSIHPFPWQHAIIVGASSGIGEALARALAAGGADIALIARRADRLEALAADLNHRAGRPAAFWLEHDVRKTAEIPALFQEAATRLQGLDLIVYAAGIMPRVGPKSYPTDDDLATVEVNFAGAVAWLNQAAVRFQRAGAGTIIGISSVAGDRGRRGNPVYNATKAALNSYLEALRNRLAVHGVTVLTAKPGYVQTDLIRDLPLPGIIPRIPPAQAAAAILDAAAAQRRVAYIPGWWRWIMLIIGLIPAPIFERLNV
jgi:decaprenylphospho-beta-D-erythro-pentofuranosid-2-ulose 2-reductase